jgi:hypothetical protein
MTRPTIQYLKECFDVDFSAGTLTWKCRPESHFSSAGMQRNTNTQFAGKPALAAKKGNRVWVYCVGVIAQKRYTRSSVIFAMAHGYWPVGVDHIDHNTQNDALVNLREATTQENSKNQKTFRGRALLGIHHRKDRKGTKTWSVSVGENGKVKHVGYFYSWCEAFNARINAEMKHGFHPCHGGCHY